MKPSWSILLLCFAVAVLGCGDDGSSDGSGSNGSQPNGAASEEASSTRSPAEAAKDSKPEVSVPTGAPPTALVKEDVSVGTGPPAKAGDRVIVQYVGVGFDSGEEFDASWDRGEPFSFQLGAGEVIPGWDQGIRGMKVGGQRQLLVPAELAYGEEGFPPAIQPNEALVFVVDLLDVE